MLDEPCHLRGAEVGIEDESGRRSDLIEQPVGPQLLAALGGPLVLPDEGWCEDAAVRAIEGHDGLALVGDPDGRHRCARVSAAHFLEGRDHRGPDLLGVVLDAAGGGVGLVELSVGHVDDVPAVVDEQGAHARGPGVDGDHI